MDLQAALREAHGYDAAHPGVPGGVVDPPRLVRAIAYEPNFGETREQPAWLIWSSGDGGPVILFLNETPNTEFPLASASQRTADGAYVAAVRECSFDYCMDAL